MRHFLKCVNAAIILGFLIQTVFAQSSRADDDDDFQSWNDLNVTVAVGSRVDLLFPANFRLTRNLGRFNQGRIGAGIAIKAHKRFTVTPSYSFTRTRNSAGTFRTENRFQLRAVYRFPISRFGLYHRSQLEYRKRLPRKSWRYRPSITLEKEFSKSFARGFKAFVTEEPFYDSAYGRFSRNRLTVGLSKSLSNTFSVELNYLRQDDISNPRVVHVIGTALKIKL